ncbi:MAG: hypothetical protein IT228_02955 [Flavobacteriales bacterium]|nr:hypothetical protein [Flavobacteriales bacterium]MCC6576279.1 hypothetical protein [Flavobacteriales bacterium]NUQ16646.1 hypothetical protein [Flavobacteriales bacterium]
MTGLLLLSATGTLRIILVLVVLWLALRLVLRMQQARQGRPPGTHWAPREDRARGHVRVERAEGDRAAPGTGGRIEDADYEEIR